MLYRRPDAGALEVLLIYPGGPFWTKKDRGAWSIPKGEVEPGETPIECAMRELEEELGSPFEFAEGALLDLGSVRQKGGKEVFCWAAEADFDPAMLESNTFTLEWPRGSGVEREYPEVDRAEWFELDVARVKINYAQGLLLDRLLERIGEVGESGSQSPL